MRIPWVSVISEVVLPLSHISWISLSKNSVSISRNNTSALQGRPDVILDSLIRNIGSNFLFHLEDPSQDFLIGETVKRASKTI